jgi:hypothetical protein
MKYQKIVERRLGETHGLGKLLRLVDGEPAAVKCRVERLISIAQGFGSCMPERLPH